MERATIAEKERNEAKEEVVARARAVTEGDAKARVDEDLARAQDSHLAVEEAKRKAEAETARLTVDCTSLLLDIGAVKGEVSGLQSQAGKDKEALEGEYQRGLEVIFDYGYGCCAFEHNICGSQPVVPNCKPNTSNLLPLEFFINPRCPTTPTTFEAATVEVDLRETTKEPTNIFVNIFFIIIQK